MPPKSPQSTRSTPTLPGREGLRVPPSLEVLRRGNVRSHNSSFATSLSPQLEADCALCRRFAVVSGDCSARPTATGVGRRNGAAVAACCRTLRGSVSQEGVSPGGVLGVLTWAAPSARASVGR